MTSPPYVLDLDLHEWIYEPVLLNHAAILTQQLCRDITERKYGLELSRYLFMVGAALAIAATGVQPQDKALAVDLRDVKENELIDASSIIMEVGRTFEELATDQGKALLALLASPIDDELMRRVGVTQ